jgi:hypothetical protein
VNDLSFQSSVGNVVCKNKQISGDKNNDMITYGGLVCQIAG